MNIIYKKHMANITLNEDNLEEIRLKSGMRQGCPPSPVEIISYKHHLSIKKADYQWAEAGGTLEGRERILGSSKR